MRLLLLAGALAVLLPGISSGAGGDRWTTVYEEANGENRQMVDFSTARRRGAIVKIWLVGNHSKAADKSLSDLVLSEYDCDERLWRQTSFRAYSRQDAEGTILSSLEAPAATWRPLLPQSVGEVVRKVSNYLRHLL